MQVTKDSHDPGNPEFTERFSTRLDVGPSDRRVEDASCERIRIRLWKTSLILLDLLLFFLCFAGCAYLVEQQGAKDIHVSQWLASFGLMSLVLVFANICVDAYSRTRCNMSVRDVTEQLIAAAGCFLFVLIVLFFAPDRVFDGNMSLLSAMALAPFISIPVRYFLFRARRRALRFQTILIIAGSDARKAFLEWISLVHHKYVPHFISPQTGLVESYGDEPDALYGMNVEEAIRALSRDLSAIVIAEDPDRLPRNFLNRLVAINFNVTPVYLLDAFHAREWQTVPLTTLSGKWALNEGFRLSQSATYSRLKRLIDIVAASIGLVLTSPVLFVVAVLIRLESPGPIIFRQKRVGLHERVFTIFKFRSMRDGSDKGPLYTMEKDNRITRIGGFLRKSRLDELPQLVNVLRGEMSLIGPRAEWDKLVCDYEEQIPYYHLRHLVRPGITGWAQVNYSYGASVRDAKIKLRYDLFYVRYSGVMLDLCIAVKTVYIVLFGKGR
jgi:exopolysaccharide biosynthesis polyprenyl glycosylphosphotransferase